MATAVGTDHNQAARGSDILQDRSSRQFGSMGTDNSGESAFQKMGSQRRRVAGMVTYLASEKDCIGEGGEPAECVICFEEFEQGVEMGRLECLCKFHKVCLMLYRAFLSFASRSVLLRCDWELRRHAYGNGGILKG